MPVSLWDLSEPFFPFGDFGVVGSLSVAVVGADLIWPYQNRLWCRLSIGAPLLLYTLLFWIRTYWIRSQAICKGISKKVFIDFPSFFLAFFIVFQWFSHVLSSIFLTKNKKIQALVKFYVFLTQKFECTYEKSIIACGCYLSGVSTVLRVHIRIHHVETL